MPTERSSLVVGGDSLANRFINSAAMGGGGTSDARPAGPALCNKHWRRSIRTVSIVEMQCLCFALLLMEKLFLDILLTGNIVHVRKARCNLVSIVIPWKPRQSICRRQKALSAHEQLLLMLAKMLDVGAIDFARIALDAWGKQEMGPEDLLELCSAYASAVDLKILA